MPVFRTIYAPVRQLVAAFSPDNEFGFKRVVMLERGKGFALGFLTKEFTIDRGKGPEQMLAVYVPTNNLYLGDVLVCERERAVFPDISVQEGIRIFLTGGMALRFASTRVSIRDLDVSVVGKGSALTVEELERLLEYEDP